MALSDEHLQRLGAIALERGSLRNQMEGLQRRLSELDREYATLKDLLSVPSTDSRWLSRSAPLVEAAYHILAEAEEPLHYKEIHRRLQTELFYIGGVASVPNLVVRLSRDHRFMKVQRGVYGLSEWGQSDARRPTAARANNELSVINNDRRYTVSSEAVGREIQRTRFVLDSVAVDVQVTQASLRALRDLLLGRDRESEMFKDIDPIEAIPAQERKLMNLLAQRDRLLSKLRSLQKASPPLDSGNPSRALLAIPRRVKGGDD